MARGGDGEKMQLELLVQKSTPVEVFLDVDNSISAGNDDQAIIVIDDGGNT